MKMKINFSEFFFLFNSFIDLMHGELGTTSLDLNYDGSQSPGSGGSLTQQTRNKRMRTSFKHHQLRTMKSYFAINQNPDAKDLKQLSQKTGLSKRVLQVIEQFRNYFLSPLFASYAICCDGSMWRAMHRTAVQMTAKMPPHSLSASINH